MIKDRCDKHNCPLVEISRGDYGVRLICIDCCDEALLAEKKQQENDYYGTELEFDDLETGEFYDD